MTNKEKHLGSYLMPACLKESVFTYSDRHDTMGNVAGMARARL